VEQVLVNSVIRGSLLALLALGITLVFSVSRFANIMQVEFATIGAYGTILVSNVIGGSLLLDSAIAIVGVALVAVASYHLVFVRLLRRDAVSAMIGSFALSIVLRAVVQTITGPNPRSLDVPIERGVSVLGVLVAPTEIRMTAISIVALAAVMVALRCTPFGRAVRGVAANPDLVAAAGLNVRRIVDAVWILAGVLGGLAGVALAVQTQASLGMGIGLLLPVFAAALLGGFGSPGGAIVAAYALALAENVALQVDVGGAQLPVIWQPAIGFVLLVVVLVIRPQGLFGRQGRRA
jgi:branched-subunit amino acid ABC-type transport system permease component